MDEKTLLEKYVEARKRLEALDAQIDEAKDNLEQAQKNLHESLAERQAKKTAVYDGIGSYAIGEPTLYASIDKEYEEELFKLLQTNERGDLIKPTVHHRSLATFIKEYIEEGKEVPSFVKLYYKPTGRLYVV